MNTLFSSTKIDWSAIGKNSNLSPSTKQHLTKVYASLLFTLLASAAGAMAHMAFNIGGMLTYMGVFGMTMWFSMTRDNGTNQAKRLAMLLTLGALKGASIGPLIARATFVDPAIVTTALLGTTVVFACFSGAALLAKRRSWLYIGGFLSSCMSLMFFGSIINLFFRSSLFFNVQLYLGLAMFCGFVIFDTQLIVERHVSGDNDYLGHALKLFLDFVAIFVRLLIILSKNSQKKRRNNNN